MQSGGILPLEDDFRNSNRPVSVDSIAYSDHFARLESEERNLKVKKKAIIKDPNSENRRHVDVVEVSMGELRNKQPH